MRFVWLCVSVCLCGLRVCACSGLGVRVSLFCVVCVVVVVRCVVAWVCCVVVLLYCGGVVLACCGVAVSLSRCNAGVLC